MIEYTTRFGKAIVILRRYKWDSPTHDCPFCRHNHIHGGTDGHRVAHCSSECDNFEIEAPDGTKLYMKDGYVLITNKK
jgi:hypothetical protein